MSEMPRRKFLKRTGGATVAAMVAWSSTTARTQANVLGTASSYDIWSLYSEGDGVSTAPPTGAPAGYSEAGPYAIDIDPPASGLLEFKLKVKTSPTSLTTHPDEGSIFYSAEAYGTLGTATIQAETPQWEFKGACNTATGHLTPSDALNAGYSNPSPNSNPVYVGGANYRVLVEIVGKTINPPGGGSEITLTGDIKARVQSQAPGGNWVDSGSTPSKPFKLMITSHLHAP